VPLRKTSKHLYYGQTTSLCEECLELVPAKIQIEGENVYYSKRCMQHGSQKTLVSTDADYFRHAREYIKPGERPLRPQTSTERGCPYDCGLCPDHEQHSCVAIVEINEACNLNCPVCFAESSPQRDSHRSLATIERMLDALVASEGEPDVVQLSGGEPTIHPRILDVIALAKRKPIRHLMLNTNGLRIANEPGFAAALVDFAPGFEVYLQFDSTDPAALRNIRGADLVRTRLRALERLEAACVPTTLVVTVKGGVNDTGLWGIVELARDYGCVRGVTFQPVQDAGRNEGFRKHDNRVLLSDIRRSLIRDSDLLGERDVLPLPCNPEYIAIAYFLRKGRELTPVTSLLPEQEFLGTAPVGIAFERDPRIRERLIELLSLSTESGNAGERLERLLCCLPEFAVPEAIRYENVFRITIVQFLDRFNFCIGGVKRSCIHIVHPDGRIIPFDTYHLFYREQLPQGVLSARGDAKRETGAGVTAI